MQRVLKSLEPSLLIEDAWQIWKSDEDSLPEAGHWLWPLDVWLANKAALSKREAVGVWLQADADLSIVQAEDFQSCELIAVHFEQFGDGRGLSTAALLRKRYQYRAGLRAFGDVLPDVIDYMSRCGFDSFALRRDEELQAAQDALTFMDNYYQSSVVEPRPLFKKVKRLKRKACATPLARQALGPAPQE